MRRTLQRLAWVAVPAVALVAGVVGLADQVDEARAGPADAGASAAAPPPRIASNATMVRLSRLHHVADRQVQLGRLAAVAASRPETRTYGARLATDFQALDQRINVMALDLGIDPARLGPMYAGENTASLRRQSEDLTRLASESGDAFDRRFWVIVAQDQLAASDMLLPVAGADPSLEPLVADVSRQLATSSRQALAAAEPVGTPPRTNVPPAAVAAPAVPPAPVTAPGP